MDFLVPLAFGVVGAVLLAALRTALHRARMVVPEGHIGLLYRDGRLVRELAPGGHFSPALFARRRLQLVPIVPRSEGPFMIEVLSSERFALRIGVALIVRIAEPRRWAEHGLPPVEGMPQFSIGGLFPMLHNGLSAKVAARVAAHPLDEILAKPALAVEGLTSELGAYMPGGEVVEIIATSLALPPELRKMLSEVERAKREGQAALERARAEQAAMRVLANAARLLDNNPSLAQLRLLQVMETAKGQKSFVMGNARSAAASEIIVTSDQR